MLKLVLCLSVAEQLIHHTSRPFEGMTCRSEHMYSKAAGPLHVYPVPFHSPQNKSLIKHYIMKELQA